MKTITAKFSVTSIKCLGNGGGSSAVLIPTRNETQHGDSFKDARIEIDFEESTPPLSFGIYEVTLKPEETKQPEPKSIYDHLDFGKSERPKDPEAKPDITVDKIMAEFNALFKGAKFLADPKDITIAQLKNRNNDLADRLERLELDYTFVRHRLDKRAAQVKKLKKKYAAAISALNNQRTEIDLYRKALNNQRTEIDLYRKALEEQIGEVGKLKEHIAKLNEELKIFRFNSKR